MPPSEYRFRARFSCIIGSFHRRFTAHELVGDVFYLGFVVIDVLTRVIWALIYVPMLLGYASLARALAQSFRQFVVSSAVRCRFVFASPVGGLCVSPC